MRAKSLHPRCADPSAPVESCASCGAEVRTCERATPKRGWNYRCPAHPDGVEIAGRWFCDDQCADRCYPNQVDQHPDDYRDPVDGEP